MERLNKIITIIVCIIILGFSISFVVLKKEYFSDNEFRYLEKWPKFSIDNLLEGKYINGVENYTTDHFPLREQLVSFKTFVKNITFENLIQDVYVGKDGYLLQKYDYNDDSKIINILNKFYNNNKDINMYMLLAPTSILINSDKLPKYSLTDNELDTINMYEKELDLNFINVVDSLNSNKDKYQLYYRTDHHWTSYGAYIAYLDYCNKVGIDPITDYDIVDVNNEFIGTLYSKVFPMNYKKDIITKFNYDGDYTVKYLNKVTNTLYEDSFLDTKDKYSYYLGGNQPLLEITNNNNLDKDDILIIKDSYANAFIPFIVNNYRKVYVIDPRYYNLPLSSFIKDKDIKNVLILYNVLTISNDTGIKIIK